MGFVGETKCKSAAPNADKCLLAINDGVQRKSCYRKLYVNLVGICSSLLAYEKNYTQHHWKIEN